MSREDTLSMPRTKANEAVRCSHCGLTVPHNLVRDGEDLQFCCNGCRQVYQLLHDVGATDYYRLRKLEDTPAQAARVSGRSFTDFDNDLFQNRFVATTDRSTRQTELYLEGVHCAACVWLVENVAARQPGVVSLRLDLPRARAILEYDPDVVPLSTIAHSLDSIGYTPHAYRADEHAVHQRNEDRQVLIRLGVAAACAINIMVIQVALYAGEYGGIDPQFEQFFRWISLLLTVPVVGFSARPFFVAAWAGIKQRVPHMDLPISIAILAGFFYSTASTLRGSGHIYFDSITALVALLLAGRFVQTRAQRAAMDLSERMRGTTLADFARRIDDDGEVMEVPLDALKEGDRILVRSGEMSPVDGVILNGGSTLNVAVLTGESAPLRVGPGDAIHAGATNLGAQLEVLVQAIGEHSRVGALMRLVDMAASSRAPIVQIADRISRYFVVVVLGIAAASALAWYVLDPTTALEHVIALLVITCPCALGLATPVAISVSLSKAASRGIYIKQADIIERMNRIKTVFLDKTGTLTRGDMRVTSFTGSDALAKRLAALEAHSSHPIALAITRSLSDGTRSALDVEEVLEQSGMGISGLVDGRRLFVGTLRFMEEHGILIDHDTTQESTRLSTEGLSPVIVAEDGRTVAVLGLGDPLRPEAVHTVATMKALGWTPYLLSGDHPEVVTRVAAQLGIAPEHAYGGLTPEAKHAMVAEYNRSRKSESDGLLMLGDGVNDAAALALADVGISMHGGTGASILAADVVLTRAGLLPLLSLLYCARRKIRHIYRNLGFSLVYNVIGATLAVLGLVGPLTAAVLMPISSLTVILSSVLGQRYSARSLGRSAL